MNRTDHASGKRGLPGGSSLARLLEKDRGSRNKKIFQHLQRRKFLIGRYHTLRKADNGQRGDLGMFWMPPMKRGHESATRSSKAIVGCLVESHCRSSSKADARTGRNDLALGTSRTRVSKSPKRKS
jgi:hypothetical protein